MMNTARWTLYRANPSLTKICKMRKKIVTATKPMQMVKGKERGRSLCLCLFAEEKEIQDEL